MVGNKFIVDYGLSVSFISALPSESIMYISLLPSLFEL